MTAFTLSRVIRLVAAGAVFAAVAAGAATAADTYAALGDSYSSGVGTGSYTLDSACKRGVYAYPYLWTQKHPGTTLSFVACSGAKTSDLLANQIEAVTSATTLVTMTIGGNDIGFASLIYQCTLGDCSAALDSARANLETTARRQARPGLHHRQVARRVRRQDRRARLPARVLRRRLPRDARNQLDGADEGERARRTRSTRFCRRTPRQTASRTERDRRASPGTRCARRVPS